MVEDYSPDWFRQYNESCVNELHNASYQSISSLTTNDTYTSSPSLSDSSPGMSSEPPNKYIRPDKENIPINRYASQRFPTPCPLPTKFNVTLTRAIEHQNLVGNHKLALVREACEFFYSLCPYIQPLKNMK